MLSEASPQPWNPVVSGIEKRRLKPATLNALRSLKRGESMGRESSLLMSMASVRDGK
jgi:hypothetical protein